MGAGDPVYLADILKYICAEILELAGNAATVTRKVVYFLAISLLQLRMTRISIICLGALLLPLVVSSQIFMKSFYSRSQNSRRCYIRMRNQI